MQVRSVTPLWWMQSCVRLWSPATIPSSTTATRAAPRPVRSRSLSATLRLPSRPTTRQTAWIKPTIAALRAWLKTCPLIADEQEATGAAFRIAGLEEESTAFSIEDSPGDPIITEYISGWEMAKNYLFLSRREYSEVDAVNIQNSGFFEQLTEWVMRQDARHNLPDLSACGGGKTPTGIAVTNSGYIVTNSAGSCKMQLQMRLTYYMPK